MDTGCPSPERNIDAQAPDTEGGYGRFCDAVHDERMDGAPEISRNHYE